jgi:hypothetical protein
VSIANTITAQVLFCDRGAAPTSDIRRRRSKGAEPASNEAHRMENPAGQRDETADGGVCPCGRCLQFGGEPDSPLNNRTTLPPAYINRPRVIHDWLDRSETDLLVRN